MKAGILLAIATVAMSSDTVTTRVPSVISEEIASNLTLRTAHGCLHGTAGASAARPEEVKDGSIHFRFKDENADGHFEWRVSGKGSGFIKSDVCQVVPGKHLVTIRADKDWTILADSFGRHGVRSWSGYVSVQAHSTTIVTLEHVSRIKFDAEPEENDVVTLPRPG